MPITYPRPVGADDRYDLYDTGVGISMRLDVRYPQKDGGEIADLPANLVWMHRQRAADPAYDPATQKLGTAEPSWDVDNGVATYTRPVVALTAQEQAAYAEGQADGQEANLARQAYTLLKNGNATSAQAQRILARVVKEIWGDDS